MAQLAVWLPCPLADQHGYQLIIPSQKRFIAVGVDVDDLNGYLIASKLPERG